jgi:hypothetical protein
MFQLVAEDAGEFIFGVHDLDETETNENVAAGQREGVEEILVADEMETVLQLAIRMGSETAADALDVAIDGIVVADTIGAEDHGVVVGQVVADASFFVVGEAGELQRRAESVALSVGHHVDDGIRGSRRVLVAALHDDEAGDAETENQDESEALLHRYCRMVSRYLL